MALEAKQDVEQLADQFTRNADETHTRLIRAIEKNEISQEDARVMFQHETSLRQQANSLYIDAAKCVVEGLALSQEKLVAVIDEASERIATIAKIAAFLDLVADILALATAAYAAKPKPILAALKEVQADLKALKA